VSNFVKKQWSEGLIFLWTAIEQVINIIWKNEVLKTANDELIDGRTSFLKDFRTWTTSTKIKVLYQSKHLKHDDYKMLNVARKARNEFIHNASALSADKVKSALEALFRLISLIISDYKSANELDYVLELIYSNQRGSLYPKADKVALEDVTHWRKIPPLPGDTHWQGECEIIDELVLKPIVN
jgi:uncharacterized protein YutE (UPF0331/DUF86 family)